jgi:two-component system chemotaxis response regulator CheB
MTPPEVLPWYIAIGASGREGLDDIRALMAALPPSLAAVVLIVLHRPWDRLSHLRSILAKASRMPVVIAADGERFEPGTAYIGAPADHLTLVARSFGELIGDPDRRFGNRTVDLLFQSVAKHGGERMVGVVLSGALDDGSRGLAAIHHAGGLTMVLTSDAGAGSGMPMNAAAYDGPVDVRGDPAEIAAAIQAAVGAR